MLDTVPAQERNWAMAAHLSALVAVAGLPFGHVLGPLVVYLIKGHESPFVAEHAKASLNYQITISLLGIVAVIVIVATMLGFALGSAVGHLWILGYAIGLPGLGVGVGLAALLIFLLSIIFIICGTLAANEGRPYTYPFAIRFLR